MPPFYRSRNELPKRYYAFRGENGFHVDYAFRGENGFHGDFAIFMLIQIPN